MESYEKLTEQNFKKILVNVYIRGQETDISVLELIEEIKQQFLSYITK
ncbi:MAG TPA: hypothetical protein VNR61_08225 [Niallia sp.]|nr:hypothetical protein [Niallia sp.]